MVTLQKGKLDYLFSILETVFKYMFLTLTLFSFNNLFAGHSVQKYFVAIVAVFGAVLVCYRLFNAKKYIRFYGFPLLILFLISYLISTVVNYKYGISENIQAITWMTFHFAILYPTDVTGTKEKEDKTYVGLLTYFMVYIALANIVSIGMLFAGYGKTALDSATGNMTGFVWGRLWGVYSDPNFGSVLCIAALLGCLYFLRKPNVKVWVKVLLVLDIMLSLSYIAFSDSRTGLVSLLITLLFYSYIALKSCNKIKFKFGLKQMFCIAAACIIAFAGAASLVLIRNTYNAAVVMIHEHKMPDENPTEQGDELPDESGNDTSDDLPEEPPTGTIDRTGNELDQDISNRRFALWASGIEVWSKAPIFGVSHRNIVSFALANVPDTYLVNNDRIGDFNSTHNAYVDVLLSQGIVGAVIFLVFFVIILCLVFRSMFFLKNNEKCTPENLLSLGLILTFAVSACFILEIVYINTAGAFLFWMSLGRLVRNLRD